MTTAHAVAERPAAPALPSLSERFAHAGGPIVAGMVLDAVDLATMGPIGIVLGMILGGAMGWWIAAGYGLSMRARVTIAMIAGLYCTIPATEVLPIATVIGVVTRFAKGPTQAQKQLAASADGETAP